MLGQRLRMFRRRVNKTQADIAQVLHMSQSSYAKIENGKQNLSVSMLPLLASYYDVTVDYLLDYHGNRNDNYFDALGILSDNGISCVYYKDIAMVSLDNKTFDVPKDQLVSILSDVAEETDTMLLSVRKPLFVRKLAERLEML